MKDGDVRELRTSDGTVYSFRRVALRFEAAPVADIFTLKNNKSLADTLAHPRYTRLAKEADQFSQFMNVPLGEFLAGLKRDGNAFYRRFLNKHGDKRFSVFTIDDPAVLPKKGVYAYFVRNELRYVGRCRDSMKRRINQGYGKIHPKNCYIDGQSTNCHLNARITDVIGDISLWFCPLESDDEIIAAEMRLFRHYRPEWNVQTL